MALSQVSRRLTRLFRKASSANQSTPPNFEDSLDNEIIPKHILDSLESYGYPEKKEIEPRPLLPSVDLNIIQYNKSTGSYDSFVTKSPDYFMERRVIFVGIVGAFVPECTCEVVYEWARASEVLKEDFYIDEITVVSKNDPFVMSHFAKKLDYQSKLNFLADWDGKFLEIMKCNMSLGLELGDRNHRFVAYAQYGILKVVHFSSWNKLYFTKSIHPCYIWRYMTDKKRRAYYFC
ncbi:hypothetical protein SteCoe_4438 [Stentor coeruleus]|uniref:Redoxin domain-containing protein n=1 Tax=Stentor coeruleus TaxID=5963 RepID=A0A1R2CUJ6_9CILI|nr:hypothetical protein SteCoe_4438 [Stentor coeruleus]